MKIIDFLKDYDVNLGDLDTEGNDQVIRKQDATVANVEDNIEIYRENGLDEVINAAGDFNLDFVQDDTGNLFAETALKPAAEGYYSNIVEPFASQIAEILILNSQSVDECTENSSGPEELTECYMNRVFQSIAVAGLTRTFPIRSGPNGSPIPIFNVVPSTNPSGFSIVFVTTIISKSSSELFVDLNFTVSSPFDKVNRFRWKKSDPPEDIKDVFNPKATVSDDAEGNIDFNFDGGTTLGGSAGSVFFDADLSYSGSEFSEFEVNVQYEQGDQTVDTDVKANVGEQAYIKTTASTLALHDFDANGNFKLGSGPPAEEATFEALTIDNTLEEHTITGPVDYTASELKTEIEDNINSADYIDLTIESDKLKASGDVAHLSFDGSSNTADPMTALFNLPVYVYSDDPTISNSRLSNIRSINVLQSAPFFEGENKWNFISGSPSPVSESLDSIAIEARAFDPSISLDDTSVPILDKSLNDGYNGFGGTKRNYQTGNREDVSEGESLLEDFFKFHKNYVEENFEVIHIGLNQSSPPVPKVSKEGLTVEL